MGYLGLYKVLLSRSRMMLAGKPSFYGVVRAAIQYKTRFKRTVNTYIVLTY